MLLCFTYAIQIIQSGHTSYLTLERMLHLLCFNIVKQLTGVEKKAACQATLNQREKSQ